VCLTDKAAKRSYHNELLGEPAIERASPAVDIEDAPSVPRFRTLADDLLPYQAEENSATDETVDDSESDEQAVPLLSAEAIEDAPSPAKSQAQIPTTLAGPPLDATPPEIVIPDGLPANALPLAPIKIDPAAAEAGTARARRGLGTKRALYFRIARTRKLLAAWEQAGKFLAQPQRRITRPGEATEFIRVLARIQSLLRGFPPVLGFAGQPGYLVFALAMQPAPVPMFQTLLPSQRESLAQHWAAGRKFLAAHCQFLRQEARARRRRSRLSRAARAMSSFIAEYPEYVLFALAILAVTFAIARL